MQKDIAEKRLEDCNDVFADIYNALVFGGRKVLEPEELVMFNILDEVWNGFMKRCMGVHLDGIDKFIVYTGNNAAWDQKIDLTLFFALKKQTNWSYCTK